MGAAATAGRKHIMGICALADPRRHRGPEAAMTFSNRRKGVGLFASTPNCLHRAVDSNCFRTRPRAILYRVSSNSTNLNPDSSSEQHQNNPICQPHRTAPLRAPAPANHPRAQQRLSGRLRAAPSAAATGGPPPHLTDTTARRPLKAAAPPSPRSTRWNRASPS